MADDVNKKPGKGIDDSLDAISSIGRRYGQPGVQDTQEREKLRSAQESVNNLTEASETNSALAQSKAVQEGLAQYKETIKKLGPKVSMRRDMRRERAIRETTSAVEREFSKKSINGQIMSSMGSSGVQDRAMSMVGKSQRELESERSELFGQLGGIEESTVSQVQESLYDKEARQDPKVLQQIRANYRQKRALTGKIATIDAALKKQRSAGLDQESQDEKLLQAGQRAEETIFRKSVSDELRSGSGLGALNPGQLQQKQISDSKALADALEKLKNSAGESAEAIDGLKKESETAAENLKRTDEALRQVKAGGGGGGSTTGAVMMGIAQSFGVIGSAAQESLINQPLMAMQNRIGNASLSNRMYGMRNAAIGGDMTALMNVSSQISDRMNEFGEDLKENADIVRGARVLEGAVNTGMGVAQVVSGAKNNVNPLAQVGGTARLSEITQGVRETIGGAAQTTTATTDALLGVSRRQAELQGRESALALSQEINAVPGDFRQKLYDYSMGTRQAALAGGGAVGNRILNQYAGDRGQQGGLLSRIEQARINPEEFAKLTAQGAAEQGSVFNTEQVFAARRMERSGYGTTEQNLGRISALGAAGANNPQAAFGSVLEAAFSKGLDSSKALNMMVQNTAELVKSSQGATMVGLDTTAASAAKLASLINPNIENKEVGLARARTAEDQLNQINRGIGANFSDMLTISQISQESGLSNVGAMALKKLDNQTANTLQEQLKAYEKMTPNERQGKEGSKLKDSLFDLGLGELVNSQGDIDTKGGQAALRRRNLSVLNSGAFLSLTGPGMEGLEDFRSGDLSMDEIRKNPKYQQLRTALGKAGAFSTQEGLTGTEIGAQVEGAFGKSAINEAGRTQAEAAQAGTTGGIRKTLDESATAEGADMANKARQAARELGGVADAMGKINKQIQSLVGQLSDKTAGSFQGAAAEAAKDFTLSSQFFSRAVGDFNQAVQAFKSMPMTTGENVRQEWQKAMDQVDKAASRVKSGAK